jgi:hypothetical protein
MTDHTQCSVALVWTAPGALVSSALLGALVERVVAALACDHPDVVVALFALLDEIVQRAQPQGPPSSRFVGTHNVRVVQMLTLVNREQIGG